MFESRQIETPDRETTQFYAGQRVQMKDTDPDYPAMVVANYIFGGSISSRWSDGVRNREGLRYSVSSSFGAPTFGDVAVFSASAIGNPGNAPKVEASFKEEMAKALADGFTSAEVDAAKKEIRERSGRSGDFGKLGVMLILAQKDRTLAWAAELDAKIEALTVNEINAAFRRRIALENISVVKAGDF